MQTKTGIKQGYYTVLFIIKNKKGININLNLGLTRFFSKLVFTLLSCIASDNVFQKNSVISVILNPKFKLPFINLIFLEPYERKISYIYYRLRTFLNIEKLKTLNFSM